MGPSLPEVPAPAADAAPDLAVQVAALRAAFRSGRTRPLDARREALRGLIRFLGDVGDAIVAAVREDLGRPAAETWASEVGLVRAEARHALAHLADWTAPRPVEVPLLARPGRAWSEPEPLGVVLILGPWNYPFLLVLAPLVSALAAGDAALVKPSELAPASAALLAERLGRYVDGEVVRVVQGGPDVARGLLEHRFDHVFFTGGTTTGRTVARAVAEHLTPVTLELGGKSPALVDASADLGVAARRIAWGRFMNAGQTCVAPDYVLVERRVEESFLEALKRAIGGLYGPDPRLSPDYGRIVSTRHLARLQGLLEGHTPWLGGRSDPAARYLEPTVVRDPDPASPLMQEEIFGPVLPVIPVDTLQDAVAFVAERPEPLTVYLFTAHRAAEEAVRRGTRSGAFVVNDVVLHLAAPDLPFGGIGPSGMGRSHGRAGFETFSTWRSHLRRSTRFDLPVRYPPYSERGTRWLKRLV